MLGTIKVIKIPTYRLNRRYGMISSHACNTSYPNQETVVQLGKTFVLLLWAPQARDTSDS